MDSFDEEMKRLKAISNIEKTLKRTGTDPMELLKYDTNMLVLERVNIPRKFICSNCICKFKLTLFFCLFVVVIIDCFLLLKYLVMFIEFLTYKEDYPILVALDVFFKGVIQLTLVVLEGPFIFKQMKF
jgi:hypothetical protein